MSRHRSGSKKTPDIGLHMECTEEELEPCQIVHYNKAETEYNEIQNKLDNYLNKMKAEVIERGENCMVLQMNVTSANNLANSTQIPPVTPTGKVTRQSAQNYQQVVGQGILTRSSASATGNTYLMMDPCLGLVVGQVPTTTNSADTVPAGPAKSTPGTRTRSTQGNVTVTTRARSGGKKPVSNANESEILTTTTTTTTRTRDKVKNQALIQQPASPPTGLPIQQVYSPGNTTSNPGSYRIKLNAKPLVSPGKPCESNSLGGLTAGSKTTWKPSSDDPGNKGGSADSKEVTFNKMSGKTFPSLVVAARPHLRLKYIPQSNITQGRTALDAKVKGVLMYTPSTFTEWLIQEGLIKNEQICQFHVNNDLSPVKLKLGMYSDVTKFPYSGGYVWISACCPSQFVSVFSGSIFEGAPHPPTTLLKLIYHWACQTNVQNVVQWVKVDNFYVKNFFTNMRAVCTQAIHQKYQKLGGPRSKIEVGVISLGTTSQDGNMRQVKVEVLGAMDPENKLIRLRALEPISEEKNFKRRFVKILEPLEEWVHKESTIFTDFTVDKGTLINMGFRTVYQISANDPPNKYSNQNVMEYLRRIVPRMFQNTLSLLSRQIIQQFLDELVWREMWGPIPSQAFDKIISHIAEQTKLDASESLLVRLNKVASNPFKNWNYSVWKPAPVSLSNTKAQQPVSTETAETIPTILKNSRTRKRTADQAAVDAVASSSSAKKTPKVVTKDKIKKEEKPKLLEKSFNSPDKEKTITDDVISFINEKSAQISIDPYYYGTKCGDDAIIASEYKGSFQVRCSVCNKLFKENISLMKHMILHSQIEPPLKVAPSKVHQCSLCFMGFNTDSELNEHVDEVHIGKESKNGLDCQICEEKFPNRVELVYHMHRTHVEMELPYECGVCMFRTSVYTAFVDHFVQVHKGGEHVVCPFCLKVVTFAYKGKCLLQNVRFYENHLEKHTRSLLTKKCHRCKLSFIHKGILDQHLEADHCSFKGESGIEPFTDRPNPVLMPEPGNIIKPMTPPKSLKIYRARPLFNSTKFKALEVNGIEDDMACIECEGSLYKMDHFMSMYNCLKCRYVTCCEKAMAEHVTIFHESTPLQFSMGKPIHLPQGMYCVCGYSSYSGNKLAKHISLCEKKSAYPSEEAACAAMVCKDEDPSKSQESDLEAQNVLNMLGLVRKSPERGAASSDVVKKEIESHSLEDNIKQEYNQKTEEKESDCVDNDAVIIADKSDESIVKNESCEEIHKEPEVVTDSDISKSDVAPETPADTEKTEEVKSESVCEDHNLDKDVLESNKSQDKIVESCHNVVKEEDVSVKDKSELSTDSNVDLTGPCVADETSEKADGDSYVKVEEKLEENVKEEDTSGGCVEHEPVEDKEMSDANVKGEADVVSDSVLNENIATPCEKEIEKMEVDSEDVAKDEMRSDEPKVECPVNSDVISMETYSAEHKEDAEMGDVEMKE